MTVPVKIAWVKMSVRWEKAEMIFRPCDENRLLLCLINSIGNVIGLTRKKSPSTARVT